MSRFIVRSTKATLEVYDGDIETEYDDDAEVDGQLLAVIHVSPSHSVIGVRNTVHTLLDKIYELGIAEGDANRLKDVHQALGLDKLLRD
jgi:hypothetical protein